MNAFAIYVATFAAALILYVFVRWAAARLGGANLPRATSAFAALPDFRATDILVYLGSAIAFDSTRARIAIWQKASGARIVRRDEIGAWHSGVLLTVVLSRTTATPMVQLYASPTDARPVFKVGVLDEQDCRTWTAHLSAAFGAEKARDAEIRVLGAT